MKIKYKIYRTKKMFFFVIIILSSILLAWSRILFLIYFWYLTKIPNLNEKKEKIALTIFKNLLSKINFKEYFKLIKHVKMILKILK